MEMKMKEENLKVAKEQALSLEKFTKQVTSIRARQAQFNALEEKLAECLPLINEANLIS